MAMDGWKRPVIEELTMAEIKECGIPAWYTGFIRLCDGYWTMHSVSVKELKLRAPGYDSPGNGKAVIEKYLLSILLQKQHIREMLSPRKDGSNIGNYYKWANNDFLNSFWTWEA